MEEPKEAQSGVKLQWHPAFCAAAELELRLNKEDLSFRREYNLSKKPLQIDLLIIEKKRNVHIRNEIGSIFRGHNIIEYKSPDDGMTIDDFFKTLGYAYLYKGLGERADQILLEDLTVSLFRAAMPEKLMSRLRYYGYEIQEYAAGIYYVKGFAVPVQLVVTKKLKTEAHECLRVLSRNAEKEDIQKFTELASAFAEPGEKEKADAVLQVSVAANRKEYDEVRRSADMCEALRELMKEEIEEELAKNRERAIKEGHEQGMQQGIQQGMQQGMQQGIQQGIQQGMQQGMRQGIQQGLEQGRIAELVDLVREHLLSLEIAAKRAGMEPEAFQVLVDKAEEK